MFSSRKTSAPASGAVSLTKSLRLRSSASAYLNRTFGTPTNNLKYTLSLWVKRGTLGTQNILFDGGDTTGNNNAYLQINASNQLVFTESIVSATGFNLITTQIFCDPSAWYHIVVAVDTTQATSTDRIKIYVNGVQITSFGTATYPTQNLANQINVASRVHNIGKLDYYALYLDAYLTDVYFIDGQQLTPSSFGATDATTGQWSPAKYTGTYGTNGFHLTFANATSTTTLGYDTSGNSNNWTTNNISLTAGSTYDSMNDVPVAYSATAANYAVMNPNDKGGYTAFANGNLQTSNSTTVWTMGHATIGMTTGKWYWECYPTTAPNTINFLYGISTARVNLNSGLGFDSYGWSYYKNGDKYTNSVNTAYGASWTLGDTIGVAFDADAGTLTFYKNGTSQGTAFSGLTSGPYFPSTSSYDSNTAYINFGQQPFTYTPPTGYLALNTYNLPTPAIVRGNQYMDATTFTGVTGAIAVMNAGSFQPDLVWVKSRSNTQDNYLVDSNRGGNYLLRSSTSGAEGVYASPNWITSFNPNGFSSSSDSLISINYSYVAWQWQAGKGSNVSNTSGSITSTVSANTTAGFSVVTFTATANSGSIGHGLGVAPSMIILKSRNNTSNWVVYHASLGADKYLNLNTTDSAFTNTSTWQNTTPTSTVFYSNGPFVTGYTEVAYCFAPIAGYSAFGSYTGNGSASGPFIYCGFQPKFIMTKRTNTTGDWFIWDSARNTYNSLTLALYPDLSNAEYNYGAVWNFTSNGFYPVSNSIIANNSGDTYIYMAFASNPFAYSNAF